MSCVDDAEFVMLLNALERLILLGLDELDSSMAEETNPLDKSSADTSGLLSMVSNVFLTDSPNVATEAPMTVSPKNDSRDPAEINLGHI